MADDAPEKEAEEEETTGGSLIGKLFAKKPEAPEPKKAPPSQGVAHIPATVLTVEYLDESDGMQASLLELTERLQKMEEMVAGFQETQSELIATVNQQARDIGKYVDSIGRRIDQLYKRVSGGAETHTSAAPAAQPLAEHQEEAHVLSSSAGLSPQVADNPDHQNAWRIARVLAADLEAYHEDTVKEGVLYGTFYKLLREPIEKARRTYEERVPDQIVENYDYFSKAIDELIARKKMELEVEAQQ